MEDFGKQLCRLCLNVVTDENFTILENFTRDVLDMLLLKLDFEGGIICAACSAKLFAAFEFKSACLCIDSTVIRTNVDCEKEVSLDIGDIYMEEIEDKQIIGMLGDQKVCRLCKESVESEFMSVQDMDLFLLQSYIPEINFHVTRDPVVCKSCVDSLQAHAGFIQECLKTREKENNDDGKKAVCVKKAEDVKIDTTEEGVQSEILIKTEEVHIKSEECEDDWPSEKFECHRSKPLFQIIYKCTECDFHTKHKKYLPHHQLKHRDTSEVQMFKCDECDYQTKRKAKLGSHRLTHKHSSEVQMYKCKECNFETRYKQSLLRHRHGYRGLHIYKCDLCDYQTRFKNILPTHQLMHRYL